MNEVQDVNKNLDLDVSPLLWQVGGHSTAKDSDAVDMMSVKGGYVLKPIQKKKTKHGKQEIEFYETVQKSSDATIKELKNHIPGYFGTTEMTVQNGRVECLLLEDVSAGFAEPCIIDIKIGRQTWEPQASDEKIRGEMSKYPASKRDVALSIPGFQVFDVATKTLRRFDSNFGKSLDGDGVQDALRVFLNGNPHLSRTLLLQLLAKLWQILRWFRTQTRFHFFGSSILLVYDAVKLREDLKNSGKHVNGMHRPTVARQLSLRIPTGPLTPGFEVRKKSPSSNPSTPNSSSSQSPDVNDVFDHMCKTHSLDNNYEKDLQSMKENYNVVLKDLLKDRIHVDSWVNVKMIDFAHVFPANSIDRNYLEGIENLVGMLEQFLNEADK